MKLARKTLLVLVPIAILALLVGFSRHEEPRYVLNMIIAHDPPSPYYQAAMLEFARQVKSATAGDVEVRVHMNEEFGTIDTPDILDNVVAGKMEMTAIATNVLARYDYNMLVFSLPYLFHDYDHVSRVIDGPIGEQVAADLTPHGIRGLAYTYSGGFDILPTQGRAIHSPADLAGLSIRVPKNAVVESTFSSLGAFPVSAQLRKIDGLARAGLIDGAELTYSRLFSHKLKNMVLNELHHNFFLTMIVINGKVFDSLPPAYQRTLRETAKRVAIQERSKALDEIAGIRRLARARGIPIVTLSAHEQDAFIKASAPVYKKFEARFGPALIAQIRNLNVAGGTMTAATESGNQ